MNTQKLQIAINEFTKKKKSNAAYYKENWEERQERKTFYQSYTIRVADCLVEEY